MLCSGACGHGTVVLSRDSNTVRQLKTGHRLHGPAGATIGSANGVKSTVMRPEDAFAGQASQEQETSYLRLTAKDSRRVEARAKKKISDRHG